MIQIVEKPEDRSDVWTERSQQRVALFFGVSTNTIREWLGKGCPGGKGNYPLDEIAQWKIRYEQQRKSAGLAEGDDLLLEGGGWADSPNLERYRGFKADLAQLELEKKRKEVMPIDEVYRDLEDMTPILRQAGDTLQKEFGPEARDILQEALTEWVARLEEKFGGDGDEPEDSEADDDD